MYKFRIEYRNNLVEYKEFPTLKEGYDFIYNLGSVVVKDYEYLKYSS